jgi:hypothetical protein
MHDQVITIINLLRIEYRLGNEVLGLILRCNDINKAYNRIGMFISTSPVTDQLPSDSVALKLVEID